MRIPCEWAINIAVTVEIFMGRNYSSRPNVRCQVVDFVQAIETDLIARAIYSPGGPGSQRAARLYIARYNVRFHRLKRHVLLLHARACFAFCVPAA